MRNEELIPKGDGTYVVPKRKSEDGRVYVPAEYQNVDKKCSCKDPGYCSMTGDSKHTIHICLKCWGIMPSCKKFEDY